MGPSYEYFSLLASQSKKKGIILVKIAVVNYSLHSKL
jgi:hypothetical protein